LTIVVSPRQIEAMVLINGLKNETRPCQIDLAADVIPLHKPLKNPVMPFHMPLTAPTAPFHT
ncbi:hypothetical protein, partial [Rheinheimera hassiensis]|uniref:hypothetical protein n=1 Tax=Rheinheimera hassiensis TaxID=1193627 RepID=UPI001F05454E